MTIIWEPMGVSLALITLAEIGDKSQLVCMVLAARHGRARPVVFGAALAAWLPQTWVLGAMAVLFAAFGVHALLQSADSGDDDVELKLSSHGLFMTAFVMIFLAEFGDKTQIAVAGLAGIYPALAVWLGATLALALTSASGALA